MIYKITKHEDGRMKHVASNSLNEKLYIASSCWDGKHYANHSEWQFGMAAKALHFMQIPTNAKILDIGCGDGRFTKHLAKLVPNGELLGLDPSSSMLDAAQANIMPNLSFVSGNAVSLPFKNKFDRIVAFNSLHWVSEMKLALEQVCNALVPGGQVLILVAPIQVRHPLHQIINEVAKKEKWNLYFDNALNFFPFHTFAEWATLIEESGLIPENLQLIDASLDYKDKKSFADSLVGWVPFGTIPECKKKEYVADIVESYIAAIPCGPKGVVHYLLDELVIVASKSIEP